MQFGMVSEPPNTVSDTAKAVMGSNAPMMLAGVEPMMWMLDVTSANDKNVVKNDSHHQHHKLFSPSPFIMSNIPMSKTANEYL